MSEPRRRSPMRSLSEINMTPLIDLTFLLLIVFMITAPALEYGIDVSPPRMDATELPDESVMVMLNGRGQVIYEKQVMDMKPLAERLRLLAAANPLAQVLIRADGSRPYGEVIGVMKAVREAGLEKVMLVTEAEDIK